MKRVPAGRFLWSSVIAMSVVCMTGCAAPENSNMQDAIEGIQNSNWRLEQFDGHPVPVESPAITMQLLPAITKGKVKEPGKVAGSTGVNQYSGSYVSDNPGWIRFSPLASTRRAGPPQDMERESRFLTKMQQVTHYRLHDDMMSMGDETTTYLVWRR